MNRSSFLKRLGIGLSAAIVAPQVFAEKDSITPSIDYDKEKERFIEQQFPTKNVYVSQYEYYATWEDLKQLDPIIPHERHFLSELQAGDCISLSDGVNRRDAVIKGFTGDYIIFSPRLP